MINKSENITPNTIISVVPSISNTQGAMGKIASINNTSDTSIAKIPLEIRHHIGSFLKLKDKINFNQALVDNGIPIYFDKVLQEFKNDNLTQKIDTLLANKKQHYNFAKFYTLEVQHEAETDLYSFLFNTMCEDFRKNKRLSEEIAALVETVQNAAFVRTNEDNFNVFDSVTINPEILDQDKIKACVDREDPNAEKDIDEVINHIFPDLAVESEIRKEIAHRIAMFDARHNTHRKFSYRAITVTKKLLTFIKMKEEYRGIPIETIAQEQKLADSHLQPIIQKASEKMQAMPTEALRALLIMGLDHEQREDFCEKMIEIGAKANPFYAKGSPYFHMLKHDLLLRVNLTKPELIQTLSGFLDFEAYIQHVAYHANDTYLKGHIANLMDMFQRIRFESEASVTHRPSRHAYTPNPPYYTHIIDFYSKMERKYQMKSAWKEEHRNRMSLLRDVTPDPSTFAPNSPEYILSYYARNELNFASLIEFLRANPHHINKRHVNGDTLLHLSIKESSDIVKSLAELNADLNIKNAQGFTALMLAVQLEDMRSLNKLLKQPTLDVNICDNAGNTALHHAVMLNKTMAMHRLLRHEATNKNIANADGKTPYDLAEGSALSSLYSTLSMI